MEATSSTTFEKPVDAAILARSQELVSYGMLTTDLELRVTTWNAWLEIHSGIRADAAIGRSLLSLFSELVGQRIDLQFKRALRGEVAVLSAAFHEYLFPFPNAAGDPERPHMLQTARIAPLLVDGRICGTIAVIEDVTQREHQSTTLYRQQQRDRLLSSALEQLLAVPQPETLLPDLFARVAEQLHADVYLHHVSVPEPALQSASGITPEQRPACAALPVDGRRLEGAPLVLWALADSEDPLAPVLRGLGLKSFFRQDLSLGERFFGTLAFGSRRRNAFEPEEVEFAGTLCRHVAVALDRAQREAKLRDAHDELEQKVAERTARLKETITQLEGFSYTIAHDLRAPIRVMRGYADILLEELSEQITPKQRTYLAKIRIGATRMELLTRDLLEFSKISREEVHLTAVDLEELLQDVVFLTPALQAPGLLTVQHPLPPVEAQRTLLQQCLANLLENAIKFVRPGMTPRLLVRSEIRDGVSGGGRQPGRPAFQAPTAGPGSPAAVGGRERRARVRIWVEDNGIGIAPENQLKVFGMFERLHAPEGYEGTGVGLAIVARSVQRMGGSCGVESQLGQGSRFWIELPAAPA